MNRLSNADRTRVIACLVEGNSQRATTRITGIAKKTVARLAVELGEACERFTDRSMRNLQCERIQCDEIWSFVGCKNKNRKKSVNKQHPGDVWTWVAIDPDTKLIPFWSVQNQPSLCQNKTNDVGRLPHETKRSNGCGTGSKTMSQLND